MADVLEPESGGIEREAGEFDEPVIALPPDPEVPEADALEQAAVVDDDDDWR